MRLENPIEPLGEDPTKDKTETSCWEPTQQISLLSVDRAVDRQRSDFRPLGKRSTGRSTVDPKQRVKTLCRSIVPVDRKKKRALLLLPVDWSVDRSALVHFGARQSIARSTDRAVQLCQRSTGRSTGWGPKIGFCKSFWSQNFFNKISFNM